MSENKKPLLKTKDVSEVFGGLKAVSDFNFMEVTNFAPIKKFLNKE